MHNPKFLIKVYDHRSGIFWYQRNAVHIDSTNVDIVERTPIYLEISFFTGVCDSKSKQIYGGDVVAYSANGSSGIATVTYYDTFGAWGLFTKSRIFLHECSDLEVLGFHREPAMFEKLMKQIGGNN